jgi:transcriptional regulator with XRE-family HTH domain
MDNENPIRAARLKMEITQSEMASALGVNLSTIWRYEKDKLPISPMVLRAVNQLVAERESAA